MTRVAEIMTRGIRPVHPSDSAGQAAQAMRELQMDELPVCDGHRLVGVVCQRDMTAGGIGDGQADPGMTVSRLMSSEWNWCYEDQPVEEVLQDMSQRQITRLPVVDRQHRLVGMLDLGDRAGASVRGAMAAVEGPAQKPSVRAAAAGTPGKSARRSRRVMEAQEAADRQAWPYPLQSGHSPRGTSPADEDRRLQGW